MGPRLWLARHGQSTWNAAGTIQGQADPPLSDLGARQAEALAERLATRSFAALYTSDLTRCRQTAAPVERRVGLEAVSDPGLRELDFGRWQGLTAAQVEERWPEEFARWRAGDDFPRGGGESHADLEQRAVATLSQIAAAHEASDDVVVVTHGGIVRAIVGWTLDVHGPLWTFGVVGNGSLTLVRFAGRRAVIDAFNDRGHLDGLAD